jgi:hypothetical protein
MTTEIAPTIKLRTNIFRGCRRCGGTLRLERNLDSRATREAAGYVCLQCGRHSTLAEVVRRTLATPAGSNKSW